MTTTNEPFTAKSEDGAETRVITHTNGDRTIVPASVTDDQADELAKLSGDELHDAIEKHVKEQADEQERQAVADATAAVVADPPEATQLSTSPLAGPDPTLQGGSATGGEGGAGQVYPTTIPAPGFQDAETVKVAEASDPTGGVESEKDDAPRTTGPNV